MAQRVVWTRTAWSDLESVAEFISRDSPYYAASFVRQARDASRSLTSMSSRGRMVPEIGRRNVRELIIQGEAVKSFVDSSVSDF